MKWYSSDIRPKSGKWVIFCWQSEGDPLDLNFEVEQYFSGYVYHKCWAYIDMEDFLNGKIVQKSDLPQYTGKRLITL